MTASEWADQVRRMDGARHFSFDFAPYQREMMAAPYEPGVQMVVYMLASRLGKTECVMNMIGHAIDERPKRVLVMYPTVSQAEKWSKETLERELFEPTPNLRHLVRGGRRNSSNTILHKLFPGGLINIFGGNAPGELRRAKGNFLFADEIDALQESDGDEGDQLEVFWVRGSEYPDTVRIAASYPSVAGMSRIERLMAGSDYRKYFTPCPKCGEHFVMLRDQVRWPKGKPEQARIECPECSASLTDTQRRAMIAKGHWKATQDFAGVVGFWGNGMLSPHPAQKGFASHLHWVAAQADAVEKADNAERARRVLVNTFDALPYEPEQIDAPEPRLLMARAETYDPREQLPEGVRIITAGVDVQKRWLEASVWGWGENREAWVLEHRRIQGGYDSPETWASLERWLASCNYPQGEGELRLLKNRPSVFVDSSHWGDLVMAWTRTRSRQGIYACQGSPTINAPVVGKRRQNAHPKAWVYPVGVNQAKDIIYSRLSLEAAPPGEPAAAGFIHFPRSLDAPYFDGLCAEIGKEEVFRGEIFTRYYCPPGRRNEPLDVACYAFAALQSRRVRWKSAPVSAGTSTPDAKPGRTVTAPRSWMRSDSGWKI